MSNDDNPEKWLQDLDRRRRSIDLRLDREGRWWHDGQPFDHPRLIDAFNRGLALHEESREPILRVGTQWCYIRCCEDPIHRSACSVRTTTPRRNDEHRGTRPYSGGWPYISRGIFVCPARGRSSSTIQPSGDSVTGWLISPNTLVFVLTGPDGTCWPIDSPPTELQPA